MLLQRRIILAQLNSLAVMLIPLDNESEIHYFLAVVK
jgi:hypothetical protein